jgi:hypothetical protein
VRERAWKNSDWVANIVGQTRTKQISLASLSVAYSCQKVVLLADSCRDAQEIVN